MVLCAIDWVGTVVCHGKSWYHELDRDSSGNIQNTLGKAEVYGLESPATICT